MDNHENDLRRVRALIRAYGSSSDRWPEAERPLAVILSDESVSKLADEERAFDDLLDVCEIPAPSQTLINAVLTIPTRSVASGRKGFALGLWPFRAVWQPASIAAVALVAGIAAGQVSNVPVETTNVAADTIGMDEEVTVAMGEFAMGALYITTEDQP